MLSIVISSWRHCVKQQRKSSFSTTKNKTLLPRVNRRASSKRRHNAPQQEEILKFLTSSSPLQTKTSRSILEDVDRRMKERPSIQQQPQQPQPPSLVSMADSTIFEMFPTPPPPRPVDAFPIQAWEQYETVLTQVLLRHEKQQQQQQQHNIKKRQSLQPSVREWLYRETPAFSVSLPLLEHHLQHGHEEEEEEYNNHNSSDEFLQQIQQPLPQTQIAQGILYQVSCQCARKGWGWAVHVLWPKVKEAGMTNEKLLHNLLYLSSLQQQQHDDLLLFRVFDNNNNNNTSDNNTKNNNNNDMRNEIAWYHDLLYSPVAQSIQARVQWFVDQGQAAAAERWLDRVGEDVRLRVYTPILQLYLERREFAEAVRLYRRMRHTLPLVHFRVETYLLLLASLASQGCFALLLGNDDNESGPELFHSIVQEMADDPNVMELPLSAAIRLRNAFADYYDGLSRTSALQPLPLITESSPTVSQQIVAERVRIDSSTGKCPVTHVQLRLLRLTVEQRQELRMRLLDLAKDNQRGFVQSSSKKSDKNTDKAPLLDFITFLQERPGPPFTIIVDGANVAYYMQNFQEGRFSFHQIQWVVEDLKRRGEHALVVLPQKYMRDVFHISVGVGGFDQRRSQRQVLTDEEKSIRDQLVAQKQVYVVQQGFLDDFYWITASVTDQTNAMNDSSHSSLTNNNMDDQLWVPPDNPEGRWPGARPLLISNDRMRDHKMSMMEPQLFRRWFSNYMVNYSFPACVEGTRLPRSEIHFLAADAFSREIQSNPLEDGRIAWHFPLQDTTDEWFCVVLPHCK